MAAASAWASRSTTGFGVFAGTYSSITVLSDASAMPFSAMVGTSGIAGWRLSPLMTRQVTSPDLITGIIVLSEIAPICT